MAELRINILLLKKVYRKAFLVPYLMHKYQIKWWLVYGPARCGTTLINDLIATNARLNVSDWGLGPMIQLTPQIDHIKFDRKRALRDISRNILTNAYSGGGRALDIAFKQANLDFPTYESLIRMWGKPERTIFCLREPAGFIASATKKWPQLTVKRLQSSYLRALRLYEKIGGDKLDYGPMLSPEDYKVFLNPLIIPNDFKFQYRGTSKVESTTDEMWLTYEKLAEGVQHTN